MMPNLKAPRRKLLSTSPESDIEMPNLRPQIQPPGQGFRIVPLQFLDESLSSQAARFYSPKKSRNSQVKNGTKEIVRSNDNSVRRRSRAFVERIATVDRNRKNRSDSRHILRRSSSSSKSSSSQEKNLQFGQGEIIQSWTAHKLEGTFKIPLVRLETENSSCTTDACQPTQRSKRIHSLAEYRKREKSRCITVDQDQDVHSIPDSLESHAEDNLESLTVWANLNEAEVMDQNVEELILDDCSIEVQYQEDSDVEEIEELILDDGSIEVQYQEHSDVEKIEDDDLYQISIGELVDTLELHPTQKDVDFVNRIFRVRC